MRRAHLFHAAISRLCCVAIAAAPLGLPLGLGACSFDKYDGRWTANVPPTANCCPMRVVVDVDTHKFTGSVEDCDGAVQMQGHVKSSGDAILHERGENALLHFTDVNFTGTIPTDRCKRPVVGNRGG
jgi:hypothetical protein